MGNAGVKTLEGLQVIENGIIATIDTVDGTIDKSLIAIKTATKIGADKMVDGIENTIAFVDNKSTISFKLAQSTIDNTISDVVAVINQKEGIERKLAREVTRQAIKDSTKVALNTAGNEIVYTAKQLADATKLSIKASENTLLAIAETSVAVSDTVFDVAQTGVESIGFYVDRTVQNTNLIAWKAREYFRDHSQKIPEPREYKTQLVRKEDTMVLSALSINIYTDMGYPYRKTPVVLFSTPKIAVTNYNGEVVFHDVEVGAHVLEIHKTNGSIEKKNFIVEPLADLHHSATDVIDVMLPSVQVIVEDPLFDGGSGGRGVPFMVWVIALLLAAINIEWLWMMWKRKWKDL